VTGEWDTDEWLALLNDDTNNLNGIWGDGTGNLWAVGEGGTILYYNGSAWSTQESGTVYGLYGIWGADALNIWAVGGMGTILYSNDSGDTWTPQDSGTTVSKSEFIYARLRELLAISFKYDFPIRHMLCKSMSFRCPSS